MRLIDLFIEQLTKEALPHEKQAPEKAFTWSPRFWEFCLNCMKEVREEQAKKQADPAPQAKPINALPRGPVILNTGAQQNAKNI